MKQSIPLARPAVLFLIFTLAPAVSATAFASDQTCAERMEIVKVKLDRVDPGPATKRAEEHYRSAQKAMAAKDEQACVREARDASRDLRRAERMNREDHDLSDVMDNGSDG